MTEEFIVDVDYLIKNMIDFLTCYIHFIPCIYLFIKKEIYSDKTIDIWEVF